MFTVEEREKATLRQCVQARSQLEEAIGGVTRAEAQLKDNSREVSKATRGPSYSLWSHPGLNSRAHTSISLHPQ